MNDMIAERICLALESIALSLQDQTIGLEPPNEPQEQIGAIKVAPTEPEVIPSVELPEVEKAQEPEGFVSPFDRLKTDSPKTASLHGGVARTGFGAPGPQDDE